MERRIIVFAGTSEGRLLYEFCAVHGIRAVFCVATEYGKQVLCNVETSHSPHLTGKGITVCRKGVPSPEIRVGRLEEAGMSALFQEERPAMIIDATHPYAVEVTEQVRKAAARYQQARRIQEQVYYRVLRSLTEPEDAAGQETDLEKMAVRDDDKKSDVIYCPDMQQAVAYLNHTQGNILVTTGSKQLDGLCKLNGYADRMYLRILPNPDMLQKCLDKGVPAGHLLCMQGPFSTEMNTALIHENDIRYVLTKQSGRAGGYQQKVEAARQCRAGLVVILPPREAEGVSVKEMKEILLRCL